jgi:hypothetical protein
MGNRIFMAAFVCFGLCFGATVMAQDFTAGKIRYRVTGDRTVAVSGSKNPKVRSIEIPATVENKGTTYRVTDIGDGAFRNCGNLASARLPEGLTDIGAEAFNDCRDLTEINIPRSVKRIGNGAFDSCGDLVSIRLPESLTDIGASAFSGCWKLTDINIPLNVTSIGDYAFERCDRLASVRLPEGLTDIGKYAFRLCRNLTDINIPRSVKNICDYTFLECGQLVSVRLPEGLTGIGTKAFYRCGSLTDLNIPSSVKYIDTEAFMYCNELTVKSIPAGLERVGPDSFKGCRMDENIKQRLDGIRIRTEYAEIASDIEITYRITGTNSAAVTGIGENKSGKNLKILIPEKASIDGREYTVTSIADSAFFGKGYIEAVMFPQTVEHIGNASFTESGLEKIYFSEGLKSIGNHAFRGCILSDVAIPQSVTSIGSRAFYSYSNRRIAITALPAGLQKTGKDAFFCCKFAGGLVLPDVLLAQIAKDDAENEHTAWELDKNNKDRYGIYAVYIEFIRDECYTPEVLAAAKEKLWAAIRKADRKDYYSTYINNKEIALPEYLAQAEERIGWCEANKATVVMDSPEKVKSSNSRWNIDTRFRETGGKAGVTLYPREHYVRWKDTIYKLVGTQYGIKLPTGKSGSVKLDKNGSGSYPDRVSGFGPGAVYNITWEGIDDYGNKISIKQEVMLE